MKKFGIEPVSTERLPYIEIHSLTPNPGEMLSFSMGFIERERENEIERVRETERERERK